jgi:predicted esterase
MEQCRQWLASSQELTVPIACADWSFFREELFKRGGGAFPVGEGRYYLVWVPDDWETVANRRVILSLHGTGGCAEWMLNHWYQTSSATHSWVLVALQYYDPETRRYDDDAVIYRNLVAALDELQAHCPLAGSDIFYHGFSRGSAQSFPVAVRDRAGRRLFAAFIADSGCASLEYPTLQNVPADGLAGARFWMWCGENDVSTVDPTRMTCDVMEEDMRPYVEGHGGQVDALVREEGAGHGMFSGCVEEGDAQCTPRTADDLGPSLPLLFEYIESFP